MNKLNYDKLFFGSYRIKGHILTKTGKVFHCNAELYDLCPRFIIYKSKINPNSVMYYMIDRQTGSMAFKSRFKENLDNWFIENRNKIFNFFITEKYKKLVKRWQEIAEKEKFQIWETMLNYHKK